MNQHYYKWIVSLLLILGSSLGTMAQQKITEANIALTLPGDQWKQTDKKNLNGVTAYYFKREAIEAEGKQVIPNIGVVVESVDPSTDLIAYSAQKRVDAPFEVDETFTGKDKGIQITNSIGYKGRYEDEHGEHTVYVIHAIHKGKGITIICDALSTVFSQLDDEFLSVFFSVKANR